MPERFRNSLRATAIRLLCVLVNVRLKGVALDRIYPDPHLPLFNSRMTRQQIYIRSADTLSLRALVQNVCHSA